jgi:putative DNA primase/helicase
LWHCRIALGKLTLLAGRGGKGKSQITAMVAAAVTCGTALPDGQVTPKGRVLILSAEDDAEDTIVPRLIAAGADMSMVEIINGVRTTAKNVKPFMLTEDLVELTKLIEDLGDVRLIIIDPVSAYLGKVDDYNNLQLRQAMVPFVAAAAKYRAGVILVTHLNKNVNLDLIDRIMGSAAYSNLARAAMIVDEEDGVRFLVVPKINNAKEPARLNYSIEEMTVEQAGTEVDTTKILMTLAPKDSSPKVCKVSAKQRWAEFFRRELKDGPMNSHVLQMAAQAQGLGWSNVSRYREGIAEPYTDKGQTMWRLMEPPPSS